MAVFVTRLVQPQSNSDGYGSEFSITNNVNFGSNLGPPQKARAGEIVSFETNGPTDADIYIQAGQISIPLASSATPITRAGPAGPSYIYFVMPASNIIINGR